MTAQLSFLRKGGGPAVPRCPPHLRPTAKEFAEFAQLLDHMMSDNLNKEFFKGNIPLKEEATKNDGRIEVRQKGTIRLLTEWVLKKWKAPDFKPTDDMIRTFSDVRKLRQKPAHAVTDDHFDQKFFKDQRALILRAYQAVRFIRLLFANHPKVAGYEVEEDLFNGNIRDF